MSKLFFLVLILALSQLSYSQTPFHRNDLYAESFGTPLAIVSLNYEYQLQKKPAFGLRFGIGYYGPNTDNNKIAIPVGVNYLLRLKEQNKSLVELGIGATWSSDEGFKDDPVGRYPTKDDFENIFSYNVDVAFRQHLIKDKLMWRIDVSLIMNKYRTMFPFPGLSVGYRF